jgi:sulfur carrier protein
MKLIINGDDVTAKDGLNVNELLVEHDVKMPETVSVELNGQILRRNTFETTQLNEGDKIEFLYFMGGGSGAERTTD